MLTAHFKPGCAIIAALHTSAPLASAHSSPRLAQNAIKAAAYLSSLATIKLLLSLGLSPDALVADDESHWTALHHACSTNNADVVAVLLRGGANPVRTWQGKSCDELTTSEAIKLILQVHAQQLLKVA